MEYAAFLTWLDDHSAAVTALATVVLVGITAAYVIVTYLLVREQRRQADVPDVIRSWTWVGGGSGADMRLHNAGTGTAIEVQVVRGPHECANVAMPELGDQKTLRPGEEWTWRIRARSGETRLPAGDLSLTTLWIDSARSTAFFDVALIRLEEGILNDVGSVTRTWTTRELRRLGWSEQSPVTRVKRWRRTRRMDLTELLVDPEVRTSIRKTLTETLDDLVTWSAHEAQVRRDL